jgi:hypothetical protein
MNCCVPFPILAPLPPVYKDMASVLLPVITSPPRYCSHNEIILNYLEQSLRYTFLPIKKMCDPSTLQWYSQNPVVEKSEVWFIAKGLNITPTSLVGLYRACVDMCAQNDADNYWEVDDSGFTNEVIEKLKQTYDGAQRVFENVETPLEWRTRAFLEILEQSRNLLSKRLYKEEIYRRGNGSITKKGDDYWVDLVKVTQEMCDPSTLQWYSQNSVDEKSEAWFIAIGLNITPTSLLEMYRACVDMCARNDNYWKVDDPGFRKEVFEKLEQTYSGAQRVFDNVEAPLEWRTSAFLAILKRSRNLLLTELLREGIYLRGNDSITEKGAYYWENLKKVAQKTRDFSTLEWYSQYPVGKESETWFIAIGLNITPASLSKMYRACVDMCAKNAADKYRIVGFTNRVIWKLEQIYIGEQRVFKKVETPLEWRTRALFVILKQSKDFLFTKL